MSPELIERIADYVYTTTRPGAGAAPPSSNARPPAGSHWYNTTRIHHSIGKTSPIDYEEIHRRTNPGTDDTVVA